VADFALDAPKLGMRFGQMRLFFFEYWVAHGCLSLRC
jgi:hypothetical protein